MARRDPVAASAPDPRDPRRRLLQYEVAVVLLWLVRGALAPDAHAPLVDAVAEILRAVFLQSRDAQFIVADVLFSLDKDALARTAAGLKQDAKGVPSPSPSPSTAASPNTVDARDGGHGSSETAASPARYNTYGLRRLLEELSCSPSVVVDAAGGLAASAKAEGAPTSAAPRTLPFRNYIASTLVDMKTMKRWAPEVTLAYIQVLTALPLTLPIAQWVLALLHALAAQQRWQLLERVMRIAAKNAAAQLTLFYGDPANPRHIAKRVEAFLAGRRGAPSRAVPATADPTATAAAPTTAEEKEGEEREGAPTPVERTTADPASRGCDASADDADAGDRVAEVSAEAASAPPQATAAAAAAAATDPIAVDVAAALAGYLAKGAGDGAGEAGSAPAPAPPVVSPPGGGMGWRMARRLKAFTTGTGEGAFDEPAAREAFAKLRQRANRGAVTLLCHVLIGLQKGGTGIVEALGEDIAPWVGAGYPYAAASPNDGLPGAYNIHNTIQPHRCDKARLVAALIHHSLFHNSIVPYLKQRFLPLFKELKGRYVPEALKAWVDANAPRLCLLPRFLTPPGIVRGSAPAAAAAAAAASPAAGTPTAFPVVKAAPGVTGLLNLGNTCFMASFLQALYFTPLRLAFLRAPFVRQPGASVAAAGAPNGAPVPATGVSWMPENPWTRCRSLHALGFLFGDMMTTTSAYVVPRKFHEALPSLFAGYGQHDASEFAYLLLSQIESEIKAQFPAKHPLLSYLTGRYSGKTTRTVTCLDCNTKSEKVEPFMGLDLKFTDEHVQTDVAHLLQHALYSEEVLDGENKYACDACGCKTVAKMETSVTAVPPVLMLILGRFRYSAQGRRKIFTTAAVPEALSVPACHNGIDSNHLLTYKLQSVVCHSGSSAVSGHYYAHAKHQGKWYTLNDSRCTVAALAGGSGVPSFTKGTDVPYILLYSCAEAETKQAGQVSSPGGPLQILTAAPWYATAARNLAAVNSKPTAATTPQPPTAIAAPAATTAARAPAAAAAPRPKPKPPQVLEESDSDVEPDAAMEDAAAHTDNGSI